MDWAKYQNRHSSFLFLPKFSPDGTIILAKEQVHNSYTFWALSILIFSPFANFGNQSLVSAKNLRFGVNATPFKIRLLHLICNVLHEISFGVKLAKDQQRSGWTSKTTQIFISIFCYSVPKTFLVIILSWSWGLD